MSFVSQTKKNAVQYSTARRFIRQSSGIASLIIEGLSR